MPHLDFGDRQRAEHWVSVAFEGRSPVALMFLSEPDAFVGGDVTLNALLESPGRDFS